MAAKFETPDGATLPGPDNLAPRHPKLISQTAINFAANALSAAFGLFNVMVFTRLFAPAEFGIYVLGAGFASIASACAHSWLHLPVLREQARGDGTDVRGVLLIGYALSLLLMPFAYLVARAMGLGNGPALAAIGLALAVGLFELGQHLLRARLQFVTALKSTLARAVMTSALGISFALFGRDGILLLISSTLAYVLVDLTFSHKVWAGTVLDRDRDRLIAAIKAGVPFTVSSMLVALASVTDRFLIAHLIGAGAAGQYTAGADLVRQVLIIPAVSAAATFMPMAVQILASRGVEATREHLTECLELLLAITLPAALGFAIVSHHIAYVILGSDFRELAVTVMPIVCVMMVFQTLTFQYAHMGFLLSDRNSLYLISAAFTTILNGVLAYILIERMGPVGAAWGRLAAEVVGFAFAVVLTRWAFRVPMPLRPVGRVLIAALAMVVVIRALDQTLAVSDKAALIILIPAGMIAYFAMCWILNIAKARQRSVSVFAKLQGAFAAKRSA